MEDVVTAVTGAGSGLSAHAALRDQMQRAADEFDERTAEAFARALLDRLCQTPEDLRQLEALLILGLAHPSVLEKHRISIMTEGRRLALLLERAGEKERACCLLEILAQRLPAEQSIDRDLSGIMRRSGNTTELIERYLSKADEAATRGRTNEAVAWLQEIMLLDQNRRDVARMIRDLRYQDKERRSRIKKRVRIAACSLAIAGLATFAVLREQRIRAAWVGIPPAPPGDVAALRARLDRITDLISEEHVWLGLLQAASEKKSLATEIDARDEEQSARQHEVDVAREQQMDLAETARTRGLYYAEQGKFDLALADFRQSLELSPLDWEHRARVQADVSAIEAFRAEKP